MDKEWVANARDFFESRWPGMVSGKLNDKTAGFWEGYTSDKFMEHERPLEEPENSRCEEIYDF